MVVTRVVGSWVVEVGVDIGVGVDVFVLLEEDSFVFVDA